MKISEITMQDVVRYLRLDGTDYDPSEMQAIMDAARTYIASYTGIPAESSDPNTDTLDDYADFWLAYMVLCQDMYDHRSYDSENGAANRVVDSILGMHARNLL